MRARGTAWRRLAAAALAAGVVGLAATGISAGGESARLAYVVDGDTIALVGGERVRLLQIDTPEPGSAECYSRAASRDLRLLLPVGGTLTLEPDPSLDDRDAYGRLLRYVWRVGRNVNLQLVRHGSATVWFYRGERGRYSERLLAAGRAARAARRGLWGACPRAVWNPLLAATTGQGSSPGAAATPSRPLAPSGACDASYPGVCIPPAPPDLDCADVPYRDFVVRAPDPHRFDGEGDGRGCEG